MRLLSIWILEVRCLGLRGDGGEGRAADVKTDMLAKEGF